MKLKKTQIISCILIGMMLFSLMSGCGKKNAETAQTGSEVKLNGDRIYPVQCDDTLTFWFNGDTLWMNQHDNFGDTPLGVELKKKTGVNIEYIHPTSGQGNEQFQILMASDELPDIVNKNWYEYPGGPDRLIEDKYIYKLNDIFDKYCPALKKVLAEHPDWDKEIKTDKGNYHSFPMFMDEDLLLVAYGQILRADFLKELNLEVPTTIDEWENVLTQFKEKKNVEVPWIGPLQSMLPGFTPAFGIYYDWYKDGDTIKYGQAQPQYKEFLAKMNDWYKKGLIDPDFAVPDGNRDRAKLLNGEAGATMAWAGSGLGTLLETNKDVEGYDFVGAPFPAEEKGKVPEYSYISKEVGITETTAISRNCKNVELAARFLDYGFTDEGHNVYNFGVEGVSYNMVEEDGKKVAKYTDLVVNNPDGLTIANMISLYCRSGHCNVPMVQDVGYIKQYYQHQQQKDAQMEWTKTNMKEHLLPILYIADEYADRDSDIMTNVKTYVEEMTIKFITGREPLDKFDEYVAQLKEFGIDESTRFRTEAYERFLNR